MSVGTMQCCPTGASEAALQLQDKMGRTGPDMAPKQAQKVIVGNASKLNNIMILHDAVEFLHNTK